VPRLIVIVGAVLFMTAPRAATSIDWSKVQSISVLLIDDRFVPDHLKLQHGVPYRLHMENRGKDLHEFTAPAFLTSSVVRNPTLTANGGREVVVNPGKTVDLDLVPLKTGTFRLVCADHDWDGMVGEIVVE